MPFQNVDILSDEEPAPAAKPAAATAPKVKTLPKKKPNASMATAAKSMSSKTKSDSSQPVPEHATPKKAAKSKAKGKAKPKSRPSAQSGASPAKRPAASIKRPASNPPSGTLRAYKYLYHKQQMYGIKLGGKEQLTVQGWVIVMCLRVDGFNSVIINFCCVVAT